jgi:hypothetical protein
VFDDDPRFYDDTPRRVIRGPRGDDGRTGADLHALSDGLGLAKPAEPDAAGSTDSPRLVAIRSAVHRPLAAIAPAPPVGIASVASGLGDDPMQRWLAAPAAIADKTKLSFPAEPGASELYAERVPDRDAVILRVTHDYACRIPLAAALICTEGYARLQAEASFPLISAPYAYVGETGDVP